MRAWGLLAVVLVSGQARAAAPLPPPRPQAPPPAVGTPAPPAAPSQPVLPPGSAEGDATCLQQLKESGAETEAAPQPGQDPSCRIEDPVRLLGLRDPADPERRVGLPGRPVVACRYAGPFLDWLGGIAVPVLRSARSAPLSAVQTGPGFECRSRNHVPGAKLSAHGLGLALDIAGFEFADGTSLPLRPPPTASEADRRALAHLRRAACGWFLTVLGPGSDAAHADHMHLDIQQHGSSDRYRICQ